MNGASGGEGMNHNGNYLLGRYKLQGGLRMMYKQRVRLLIGVLLILMSLVTVVACAQSSVGNSPTPTSQPSLPAITIKAMNYSYDQPQTVPAGMVDITLVNNGTEPHQDNIVRLHDGVTFAQFQAALLNRQCREAVLTGMRN
jgi:hypothetical protein